MPSGPGHPTLLTPRLPPELCLRIIQLATYLPPDFDLHLWRDQHRKKMAKKTLRPRMVAARSLIRVCRAWWEFATPFLYETLWITKVRQLELLVATLSASRISTSTNVSSAEPNSSKMPKIHNHRKRALGSYVERLVLALMIPWDLDPTLLIVSLLRLLPNLRSIHVLTLLRYRPGRGRTIFYGVPAEFMQALPKTLEVLNLTNNAPKVASTRRVGGLSNSEEVCRILNGLPSLHTYACSRQCIFMTDIHTVPHLQRILVPFKDCSFPYDPFRPAVTNITEVIYDFVMYGSHYNAPNCLIRRFGHALTRVTFGFPWHVYVHYDLSIFADFFPNITRLDLHVRSFVYLLQHRRNTTKGIQLPPTVVHLGLQSQLVVTKDDHYTSLLHCCRTVKGPRLETVQLTSPHNCRYLKAKGAKTLRLISRALYERQIRLLDSEGSTVVPAEEG